MPPPAPRFCSHIIAAEPRLICAIRLYACAWLALQTASDATAFQLRHTETARRVADLWPAKRQRQAAVAQMQRLGAGGGLFLEGHPVHGVNGVYARVGSDLYEGWPRYECESGDGGRSSSDGD